MCWGLKIGPARAVDFFLAAEIWDLGWSWGGPQGNKHKNKKTNENPKRDQKQGTQDARLSRARTLGPRTYGNEN